MGEGILRILARAGNDQVAVVYLAELRPSRYVEFVESVQPPLGREKKWVLIISTLFGCPVDCEICDAGGHYRGKLTSEEMIAQVDYLIRSRFPDGRVPAEKFKIQFSRMGEPAFNAQVLDVLAELPGKYLAQGLIPSISTIAPRGCDHFFDRLIAIKDQYYPDGRFQLQFSIHTTDATLRDRIIPVKKWSLDRISVYGDTFFRAGDRKITLNFALADHLTVSASEIEARFDPNRFLIKITPVNPTLKVRERGIRNMIDHEYRADTLDWVRQLRKSGYEVIVSIGEPEENKIGSNCGQYIRRFLSEKAHSQHESYQYELEGFQVDSKLPK